MSAEATPLFTEMPPDAGTLVAGYEETRRQTEALCAPLATEDYVVQAMPDASPAKWHLGHVSWFFDAFILKINMPGYRPFNPKYEYMFNSYYNSVGPQYPRLRRGDLSRPTVAEVYDYRDHVDRSMLALIEDTEPKELAALGSLIVMGLNHEQQHQELLMTDIKYNLSVNPLRPAYHTREIPRSAATPPLHWVEYKGGLHWVGHDGNGFAFDNEWPRHQAYSRPYRRASRLVTNGEYLEFMDAGGYANPEPWLSDGWKTVQERRWDAPLYWERMDGSWRVQTLSGLQPVDEHGPVAHLSYYEADAYARWRGKRLPTEQEWEQAAGPEPVQGKLP